MFVLDAPPDVPPQYAPIVIAQASQAKDPARTDRTIGVSQLANSNPGSGVLSSISPVGEVWAYFKRQENTILDETAYRSAKATVLEAPKHGEFEGDGKGNYGYFPTDPSYIGTDHATVLVEIGGYKVKVIYFFKLMSHVPGGSDFYNPHEDKENCPQGTRVWKISLSPDDPNAPVYTFYPARESPRGRLL